MAVLNSVGYLDKLAMMEEDLAHLISPSGSSQPNLPDFTFVSPLLEIVTLIADSHTILYGFPLIRKLLHAP